MQLADLQARMAPAIIKGDARGLPLQGGPISVQVAISSYRDTVLSALSRALQLTFPTVADLVGEAFFDQAAMAYMAAHPPHEARLSTYGAAFPRFLRDYPPAAGLAYLFDVACLDQAVSAALSAPDGALRTVVLDAAVTLALPLSLRVVELQFPADLIRSGVAEGDDKGLAALDLKPRPRALAVWRRGRHAVASALDPIAGRFLARLLEGGGPEPALRAALEAASADHALKTVMKTVMKTVLATVQAEVFAAPFAQILHQPT
jgi:hypothetical protein